MVDSVIRADWELNTMTTWTIRHTAKAAFHTLPQNELMLTYISPQEDLLLSVVEVIDVAWLQTQSLISFLLYQWNSSSIALHVNMFLTKLLAQILYCDGFMRHISPFMVLWSAEKTPFIYWQQLFTVWSHSVVVLNLGLSFLSGFCKCFHESVLNSI